MRSSSTSFSSSASALNSLRILGIISSQPNLNIPAAGQSDGDADDELEDVMSKRSPAAHSRQSPLGTLPTEETLLRLPPNGITDSLWTTLQTLTCTRPHLHAIGSGIRMQLNRNCIPIKHFNWPPEEETSPWTCSRASPLLH